MPKHHTPLNSAFQVPLDALPLRYWQKKRKERKENGIRDMAMKELVKAEPERGPGEAPPMTLELCAAEVVDTLRACVVTLSGVLNLPEECWPDMGGGLGNYVSEARNLAQWLQETLRLLSNQIGRL